MNDRTPSRGAYVVDLKANPGAFRAILGETSTGYGLRWTLWGRDQAAIHLLDRIQLRGGYLRGLGFVERQDVDRTLDTVGRPDVARMVTLSNAVARLGGITLLTCPFPDDPAQVAYHLEMMQSRHGLLRVGYLDGRQVTVLESPRIEGGFQIGQPVRERGGFGLAGRIVRLGTLDGQDDDPIRVQSYVVELPDGGTIEFPATSLELRGEEVPA